MNERRYDPVTGQPISSDTNTNFNPNNLPGGATTPFTNQGQTSALVTDAAKNAPAPTINTSQGYDQNVPPAGSNMITISKSKFTGIVAAACAAAVLLSSASFALGMTVSRSSSPVIAADNNIDSNDTNGYDDNLYADGYDDNYGSEDVDNTQSQSRNQGKDNSGDSVKAPITPEASDSPLAFSIDEKTYVLPAKVETFINDGWAFNDDNEGNASLASGQTSFVNLYCDGGTVDVSITNFSKDAKTARECYITEFKLYQNDFEKMGKQGSVHNGDIILGVSKADDVRKIYGKPDNTVGSFLTTGMTYYLGPGSSSYDACLRFSYEDDEIIEYITVKNRITPADLEETVVSNEVPDYFAAYEAPLELGDSLLTGNFQVEDKVYTLPVPMQQLLDAGWKYDSNYNSYVMGAGETYSVSLRKDGNTLNATAYNHSTRAAYLSNTIIIGIMGFPSRSNHIEVSFAGGIGTSTTDQEMQTALKELGITKYEYKKDRRTYKIPFNQNETGDYPRNYLRFCFKEDGSFDYFDIVNYGWLGN